MKKICISINEGEKSQSRGSLLRSSILSPSPGFRFGLHVARACVHCFAIQTLKFRSLFATSTKSGTHGSPRYAKTHLKSVDILVLPENQSRGRPFSLISHAAAPLSIFLQCLRPFAPYSSLALKLALFTHALCQRCCVACLDLLDPCVDQHRGFSSRAGALCV